MPLVRLPCALLNCMLAGVQREAVLEDRLMFEGIDVQAQARGFHEVG